MRFFTVKFVITILAYTIAIMKKIFIWVVVILLLIGGITVFSNKSRPTETGSVKIGFIGPLTGDGAPYGEAARGGLQIAAGQINNAGGIRDRKINVIYEDGKCNNKDAASAAQKLINIDKVKIIIGGLCSGETLAIAPIAEAAKVILFSPGSSAPAITNSGDYVFRNHVSDNYGGEFLANIVSKDHSRVAIFSESTDYSQGLRQAFKEELSTSPVFDEAFQSSVKDFRSMLAKAKIANPDVIVIIAQVGGNAAKIAKQSRELGLSQPFYSAYLAGPEYLTGGKAVEGTIMIDDVSLINAKGEKLLSAYKERFGSEPTYVVYAGGAYDAMYVLAEAIDKVKEEPDKIRDYLYALRNFDGALGSYHFDSNGDVVGLSLTIKKVENGKFVEVR